MSFSPTHRRPDIDGLLRHQQRQRLSAQLDTPEGRALFRRPDLFVAMGNARPAPPRLSVWQRLIGRLFRRDRAAARAGFEQDQSWTSDVEDR